jgi:2-polyprenyl-3-methyl-5-hydroxy-6-metoxy-1,4-benzoquinol methylase
VPASRRAEGERDISPKYVFKPQPGSPHHWAIQEARALEPTRTLRVLDVGAATGYVGEAIRELRPAELTGVEPDASARAALRYPRSVESLEALPAGERWDVALLLDVIEHTADPRATLEKAARLLESGGTLLVSVPNIAHWSVRGKLLFGRFEYQPSGILDETHLHFFTRRSFLKTVRAAGLTVEREAYAIAPAELVLPWLAKVPGWGLLRALRRALAWCWPELLAFQLLARCRKTT